MAESKKLDSLLIKPAGPDCNMACGYCFYLDKSSLWPGEPKHRMQEDLLEILIRQVMDSGSPRLSFGWQGGEPTLMGLSFFEKAVSLQKRYGRGKTVGNGLQTNGLLIDAAWTDFLTEYDFLVGLSLDGPEHIHDRYRVQRNGQGTWKRVVDRAERMLDKGVAVNALVVVNDYSVDFPEEIYRFHKELGLTHMQFIPVVENRVPGSDALPFALPVERFGEFLKTMFDCWWNDLDGLKPATSIRYFDALLFTYVGMTPPDCTLQETCGSYLVVEHNGEVYACDFYVTADWKLGNLRENRLIDMLNAPRQQNFGEIKAALPHKCGHCPWLIYCRGGCPKDRLLSEHKPPLNHLCRAYQAFFEHVHPRMQRLAADWTRQRKAAEDAALLNRRAVTTDPRAVPGRNDPCPCGSGLKFKRCCGR
ncbi:MAG: anaerobic sulfatase maturase [Planctomycetes bacterium]|nr:anaerobic sulfatase maturase [Planctomycetota bacterium]